MYFKTKVCILKPRLKYNDFSYYLYSITRTYCIYIVHKKYLIQQSDEIILMKFLGQTPATCCVL